MTTVSERPKKGPRGRSLSFYHCETISNDIFKENYEEIKVEVGNVEERKKRYLEFVDNVVSKINIAEVNIIKNEFENYVESLKDEIFEEKPNEKEEEAIKRAESIYDRLDETIKRNKSCLEKIIQFSVKMNHIQINVNEMIKKLNDDLYKYGCDNNLLIDKIIKMINKKKNKEIAKYARQVAEWEKEKVINPIFTNNKLLKNEINYIKKLEEWTGMKFGKVIYSNFGEMKSNPIEEFFNNSSNESLEIGIPSYSNQIFGLKCSSLIESIHNKSDLIFLIEDEDGNKFGGFVNAFISKYDEWVNDQKSFVFSLKSNGRLDSMMKFDVNDSSYKFYLKKDDTDPIFSFGQDIIYKENNSTCKQTSFDYKGIKNALCGKERFTLKKLDIIQMI